MFRTSKSLTALLIAVCCTFLTCQKPYDLIIVQPTPSGTQTGSAVFSFAGSQSACELPQLSGNFVAGTPLAGNTSIMLAVDVTTPGDYNISSAQINGVAFSAVGTFTSVGSQPLKLIASGTPTGTGSFSFMPGTNGCIFSIPFISDPPAVFSFSGAPHYCTNIVINGIYTVGVPLDKSNTVILTASITKAGTYNITSTTANGIKFSGAGILSLGTQTIMLTGSGTPISTGANSYSVGNAGCSFSINF